MNQSSIPAMILCSAWLLSAIAASSQATQEKTVGTRCTSATSQPARIALYPTEHAPGAAGHVDLLLVSSPFDLPVTRDGRYVYQIRFRVNGMPVTSRSVVAWASTPELDEVQRIGPISAVGEATSTVSWNKFVLFVTEEDSQDGDRWSGPVLLRGVSPSGQMQSLMGHSVFGPEAC